MTQNVNDLVLRYLDIWNQTQPAARRAASAGFPGAPAAVVGFDVAVFREGRIQHVFGFLDKAPA